MSQSLLRGINSERTDEQIPLVQQLPTTAQGGEDGTNLSSSSRSIDSGIRRGEGEDREGEEEEEEETLEDYAEMVVTILQPVAITMLLVVWITRVLNASNIIITDSEALYQVYSEDEGDDTATKLFGSILNALIFLAIIIAVTVLFVILYKYRCLKVIYGWLITSTGMLLAVFGGYLFLLILQAENLALDMITFSILLWNFAVVGIMSIFWYAPQKVTQGYLIVISGLMAVWFTRLPEWTTWAILAVVAIYDLFAVLCPRGPLKVLVETAQERKEPIPALLYNASVVMMMTNDESTAMEGHSSQSLLSRKNNDNENNVNTNNVGNDTNNGDNNNNNNSNTGIIITGDPPASPELTEPTAPPEKKGVKLGLGDFVFYSVLMGRAALFDMITVFTCFIAIITGLFMTLLLLAIFRKALPALPISIALGIVFYFLTSIILWPFVLSIGKDQIFI